jgi:hypothetical protein
MTVRSKQGSARPVVGANDQAEPDFVASAVAEE